MHTVPRIAVILALVLIGNGLAAGEARLTGTFGAGHEVDPGQLPASALKRQLNQLPAPARANALRRLKEVRFHRQDCNHLHVDHHGSPFFVCNAPVPAGAAAAPAAGPVVAAAGVPVESGVPIRHSRPGATRVIYLDFNGATITGTRWNTSLGRTTIEAIAYDTDGDPSTFSDAELTAIDRVWKRVAEDYRPFEVDVTTEAPTTITTTTAVVQITRNTDASGNPNPSNTGGGVAYVNVFGASTYANYRPAWVYANNLGGGREDLVAEATAHEAGHNLGLGHDGTSTSSYYGGHGSGDLSWGPVMGTGYNRNVSQWSKGEYSAANNTQDDLAILAGKLTYRSDDHGDATTSASTLAIAGTSASASGVISTPADVDVLRFTCGSGALAINVDPLVIGANTLGGNLDIRAELLDASGAVIATNDPTDRSYARLSATVAGGTFYLRVGGVGVGSPTGTGYSDYGSLGQWTVTGTVPTTTMTPGTIAWTAATATIGEAGGTLTLTARRSGGSSGAVGVSYATANGSATAGSDYTAASGTLAWAAGETTDKTVVIAITNDVLVESAETFSVALSAATGGATLGATSTATATITDNDAYGTLAFTTASAGVGEAAGSLTLTVRRSNGSAGAVGATWATNNGSATAGSDFTAASGTLAWADGDTADKTIVVAITNDAVAESAESFTVALATATGGASLGTPASATVTITDDDSGLPTPWQSQDIGAVAAVGSASESGGTWTVRGSGADIWNTSDEFRFVWQNLTGDGEVVARVTAVGNTDAWAKAGVMIRNGNAADAAHAMMVQTPANGRSFQYRTAAAGGSSHVTQAGGTAPVWVKMKRSGTTFTGWRSDDGVTWTQVGSATIPMGATVQVGLVVTSHNDGTVCTSTFSNLGVTPTAIN